MEAQQWLQEDDENEVESASTDIFQIVENCLNKVRKLRTPQSLKMVMQLTAIVEYVKLRERYCTYPKCKKPYLSASLAIAHCMGKGKKGTGDQQGGSFAQQIWHNELYLLRHHCLPLSEKTAHHGQYTLLDNEAIIH